MSLKSFDEKFGISSSIEEEQKKFVNRISNMFFDVLINKHDETEYDKMFKNVCIQLGVDSNGYFRNIMGGRAIPHFNALTKSDFITTLRVIVAIYSYLRDDSAFQDSVSRLVAKVLDMSSINLGVKWADGIFYPTGDKLLDKELIDESVALLDKYPNEKINLKNALENYQSNKLHDVVGNCFIAVEGVARHLLNNKRTLDNNKEDLLKRLQLSKEWKGILANYLQYAHEYGRHAGENRHQLKPEEVEGFLYLTCLLIRLALRSDQNHKTSD